MTGNQKSKDKETSSSQEGETRSGRRPGGSATKNRILEAARRIIVEKGTDSLTIDAVIKEAGIGKSTFLHHYPSRTALIDALADEYAQHLLEVEEKLAQKSGKGCPMLEGEAEWYEKYDSGEIEPGAFPLLPLLLASRENRRHITSLRAWYRRLFERVKQEPCGAGPALIHTLVVDCLFFHHLFGINVLKPEEKKMILAALNAFAQEGMERNRVIRPKATDDNA